MENFSPCYTIERTAEFHEVDWAGVVHFYNYFSWIEIAEHAFLRSMGEPIFRQLEGRVFAGWPRREARCVYRRPVRFGDKVHINIGVKEIRGISIIYGITIHPINEESSLCAIGEMHVVYATEDPDTRTIKATALPEEFIHKLRQNGAIK